MTYKLTDKTIGQIAKLLQIAIITGTDIVDNLRALRLVTNDDTLDPDPTYLENFEASISKMVDTLAHQQADQDEKEN
jgi:hypothetical protein